jgi:hypothetical protein
MLSETPRVCARDHVHNSSPPIASHRNTSVRGVLISAAALMLLAACEVDTPPDQGAKPVVEQKTAVEQEAAVEQKAAVQCPDQFVGPLLTTDLQNMPEPDNENFKDKSNCEFHEWSWQMFQWLMQDVDGEPRFLSFETPYSLLGIANREVLLPRTAKSNEPEGFDEVLQAGPGGIFVDQQGNPVYYSQHLDDTWVKFIKENDLLDPEKVRAFDPNTSFPVGAIELKASWRIVGDGEDVSDMFTRPSEVYELENSKGQIVVSGTKTRSVQLALVGFHIGGVVKGHPEMIWATFEHKDNAPDVPAGATVDTIVSEQSYDFYQAGTKVPGCNVNSARSLDLKLDQETQKLTPVTNACRLFAQGNSAKNSEGINQDSVDSNDANIIALNQAVRAKLGPQPGPWSNYFEVGAIWFLPSDALKPNMALTTDFMPETSTDPNDQFLTGSLKLSNATIETFTQTQSTQQNCFRCHNTAQAFALTADGAPLSPLPPMNLNISHAFMNMYFWSQQLAAGKPAPLKASISR